jgi:hypothetical protein
MTDTAIAAKSAKRLNHARCGGHDGRVRYSPTGRALEIELILELDEFGQRALERVAEWCDGSSSTAVEIASLYYLADRNPPRSWRVPRLGAPAQDPSGPTRSISVRLHPATSRAVSEEAERRGVPPRVLAEHAVLYFLADLDSGRAAGRLERALNDRREP